MELVTMDFDGMEPLEWTDDNHAYRDRAHYHAYQRSDGNWNLAVLSMHTDEPGGIEEKLGDYRLVTLTDAKRLAQGLANLAEVDPVNGPGDRTNSQP
jgi:hypothetical protein